MPVLRTSTRTDGATSSVLGVAATQTAWASDGFGCTLDDRRPDLPKPTVVGAAGNPYTDAPTAAAAQDVLDYAFGTDLPAADRAELGTRAVVVLRDGQLVAERYAPGFGPTTPHPPTRADSRGLSTAVGMLHALP